MPDKLSPPANKHLAEGAGLQAPEITPERRFLIKHTEKKKRKKTETSGGIQQVGHELDRGKKQWTLAVDLKSSVCFCFHGLCSFTSDLTPRHKIGWRRCRPAHWFCTELCGAAENVWIYCTDCWYIWFAHCCCFVLFFCHEGQNWHWFLEPFPEITTLEKPCLYSPLALAHRKRRINAACPFFRYVRKL